MNNGRGTGREAGTRRRWEQKVIVWMWEWVWTWMRTRWCGGKRVGMGWPRRYRNQGVLRVVGGGRRETMHSGPKEAPKRQWQRHT